MIKRLVILLFLLAACKQAAPSGLTPTLRASDDSYTFGDAGVSVSTAEGVLANDTLPETFELRLAAGPAYGELSLNPDGSFHYEPSAFQEDSFDYTLALGSLRASASVRLTPQPTTTPDAPSNPEHPGSPQDPEQPTEPTPAEPDEPALPSCPATLKVGETFECQLDDGDSLVGAPRGMVLHARSGLVRWTPAAYQVGDYTLGVNGETLKLSVLPGGIDLTGIYVAPDGNDDAEGSAEHPYKTLQHAVDKATPGTSIFLRGGDYYHPEYGKPFDGTRRANAIAKITVSGTEAEPITLKAHGNEFARLITDEDALIFVEADYWTVEGLELEGSTQSLSYSDALATWWADDASKTTGRGISNRRSQHLSVRGCVVHDFPGAGVGSNGADYVTVENSLIYNNGWWSTAGTHGVANSYLTTTDPASGGDEKLVLEGNLVFSNQSLVVSHVFSKGKVALVLDEGNGLHAQNNRETLLGKARVENNLLLFNGKAGFGINTMDDITVRNNAFYKNARVVTSAGELTVQSSAAAEISNNLFAPRPERSTIKDFQKNYTNVGANATTGARLDKDLPASVQRLGTVFRDPAALDFRPAHGVPSGMGVPEADLTRMFAQAAAYGVAVAPPTQVVDTTYLRGMKQAIFDSWPIEHSDIVLEDKETGFEYSYAQRCHYPGPPSDSVCAD